MNIFGKNPNETAFIGGKKHWTDVIKNSGIGELLIWRQPEEDFNSNSTLIVMPGEVAIFVKGGTIENTFQAGTYKLSTENYPFISRLVNAFSGGISTFNCVIYFVRIASSMEINWGLTSPIQVRDKELGVTTELLTRGSYKIRIADAAQFLSILVGNNVSMFSQKDLNKYFASEFQGKVRAIIARAIMDSNEEILGISARLDEFSMNLLPHIRSIMADYGIQCDKFIVAAIDIVADKKREEYDQIGINAIAKLRNAQADKGVMEILGDDWVKQKTAELLNNVTTNPNSGGIANAVTGIGVGMASAGIVNQMYEKLASSNSNVQATNNQRQNSSKYAVKENSGNSQNTNSSFQSKKEKLIELKDYYESGLITESEYEKKKKEVLDSI